MHKAKILAIHCIDRRFQETIDRDLKERVAYSQFDRIFWPGASLDFENIKNSALVSLKLHDPDEVLIYEHQEYQAYQQENSNDTHKANAQKLTDTLIKAKPSLKVQILIATFIGHTESITDCHSTSPPVAKLNDKRLHTSPVEDDCVGFLQSDVNLDNNTPTYSWRSL